MATLKITRTKITKKYRKSKPRKIAKVEKGANFVASTWGINNA